MSSTNTIKKKIFIENPKTWIQTFFENDFLDIAAGIVVSLIIFKVFEYVGHLAGQLYFMQ